MKLLQPIQILYEFEIQQIISPVIMLKITSKIILNIQENVNMYFKRIVTFFEHKNQFPRETKIDLTLLHVNLLISSFDIFR